MSSSAQEAVASATRGNIDRDGSGYCYGCPHVLDVQAFLDDLAEDGWRVVPAGPADSVTVELSCQAAVFLRATVEHLNQKKILPENNAQALQTSAWLEEIEARLRRALSTEAPDA